MKAVVVSHWIDLAVVVAYDEDDVNDEMKEEEVVVVVEDDAYDDERKKVVELVAFLVVQKRNEVVHNHQNKLSLDEDAEGGVRYGDSSLFESHLCRSVSSAGVVLPRRLTLLDLF